MAEVRACVMTPPAHDLPYQTIRHNWSVSASYPGEHNYICKQTRPTANVWWVKRAKRKIRLFNYVKHQYWKIHKRLSSIRENKATYSSNAGTSVTPVSTSTRVTVALKLKRVQLCSVCVGVKFVVRVRHLTWPSLGLPVVISKIRY